jgi:Lon-like protease
MTQRTLAGLLAVPLLAVLWVLALQEPLPYVTYAPGMTVDVLGTTGDDGASDEIVQVEGAKAYRDDGELRLTTVLITRPETDVNLFQLLGAWVDPDAAVYPYDAVYGPDDTDKSEDTEDAFQMASSQDSAIAAALSELDYDFDETAVVSSVVPGSPAEGVLEVGDVLLTVNGTKVSNPAEAGKAVDETPDGQPVELTVQRGDRKQDLSVTRKEIDGRLRVGIEMRASYDFPVDVKLAVDPDIGGPSAGLMFSLGIYDTLTPGSLTDGETIAGTGTIQPDGTVGPIGGIDQKIAGAREDGAELFLVPADNCDDAVESPQGDMDLVRVVTLSDAVDSLEAWAADRDADLPRCTDETGDSG